MALSLVHCFAGAQEYKGFPESNGIWVGYTYLIPTMTCSEFRYEIKGDTTINGIFYHKLYTDTYIGAFRKEGSKVYYVNDEINHPYPYFFSFPGHEEVLLYDFSLNVGDEYIYARDENGVAYIETVTGVSEVTRNSKLIKTWSFNGGGGGGFILTDWEQGFGSTTSGFFPTYVLAEFSIGLITYTENEEVYHFQTSPCYNPLAIKEGQTQNSMDAYPNPSEGKFAINYSSPISNAYLSVYYSTGKILQEQTITTPDFAIDLSSYQAGIYLISLRNESSITYLKLIKE
ncbi:MAG: hypothetical protein JWM14_829 [Chitinophagaceae bacterium]|nr:hypothetical protein [Chitinophagaceae bacterium]